MNLFVFVLTTAVASQLEAWPREVPSLQQVETEVGADLARGDAEAAVRTLLELVPYGTQAGPDWADWIVWIERVTLDLFDEGERGQVVGFFVLHHFFGIELTTERYGQFPRVSHDLRSLFRDRHVHHFAQGLSSDSRQVRENALTAAYFLAVGGFLPDPILPVLAELLMQGNGAESSRARDLLRMSTSPQAFRILNGALGREEHLASTLLALAGWLRNADPDVRRLVEPSEVWALDAIGLPGEREVEAALSFLAVCRCASSATADAVGRRIRAGGLRDSNRYLAQEILGLSWGLAQDTGRLDG